MLRPPVGTFVQAEIDYRRSLVRPTRGRAPRRKGGLRRRLHHASHLSTHRSETGQTGLFGAAD
jgi:hypothetical protein